MNKSFLFLLALTAMLPATVMATIDRITTIRGKSYRQCEIVRVHPDGVSFTHANGAAKILFTDLPESWRKRLGYSPAKAEAYEKELAEKRERQAQARAAQRRRRRSGGASHPPPHRGRAGARGHPRRGIACSLRSPTGLPVAADAGRRF